MEIIQVLAKLKYLVSRNDFILVNRRASHAQAVTSSLAKIITNQLQIRDFQKHESDRDRPDEYVWVFKTEYGDTYYIKFKFIENGSKVKFISFHLSN
ncbi:type II toxin-antitoxin system MqsR family toxin [Oenococcus sp. UCMA 16435]|nr:type II toxin-antitoxin system MqsR family toxin [Oenococcus sp. UCMA 16435]MDN6967805.1 type II toxin-antitoxin system MqsR family toxin [Oenococcus sp. UCMA 17063]